MNIIRCKSNLCWKGGEQKCNTYLWFTSGQNAIFKVNSILYKMIPLSYLAPSLGAFHGGVRGAR